MRHATATVLSGPATANVTGSAFNAEQFYSCSFCPFTADNTAAGTFKVQISADSPSANNPPTNWNDVPGATATMAAGVAPAIIVAATSFKWIRVVFTRTAGVGTVTTIMSYLTM